MKPPPIKGLFHVAINSYHYDETRKFYTELLGFKIEWEPDQDNIYLTSGRDNLAVHRRDKPSDGTQALDHLGLVVAKQDEVAAWFDHLVEHDVPIVAPITIHRDGARSFYFNDPNGLLIQLIYHPPISDR